MYSFCCGETESKPHKTRSFPEPFRVAKTRREKIVCGRMFKNLYLMRTAPFRSDKDGKLLLCYSHPRGPASKDTVARWLKSVLREAGIDEFAPHSSRDSDSFGA